MELTTTQQGLEQRITLYTPPIAESGVRATIIGDREKETLCARDQQKYGSAVYLPHWREVVLALERTNDKIDPTNMRMMATSSYHVQACRRDMASDITPLAIGGVIRTADGKVLCGIRGGAVERGKISTLPVGIISCLDGREPLFANFYKELEEESGIGRDHLAEPTLVGHMTDPEFTKGLVFVMQGETSYRASELEELHRAAFAVYEVAMKVMPEVAARKEIRKRGHSNSDAWEHTQLIFLEDDPARINEAIAQRRVTIGSENAPLLDIARGALLLYTELKKTTRQAQA